MTRMTFLEVVWEAFPMFNDLFQVNGGLLVQNIRVKCWVMEENGRIDDLIEENDPRDHVP